jgi:hypothetical protein
MLRLIMVGVSNFMLNLRQSYNKMKYQDNVKGSLYAILSRMKS